MLAMVVNDNAGIQTSRVIVDHHRERARSYRGGVCLRWSACSQMTRRRASSAERHSRMSSTWRKQPRQTLCSSSRHTPLHGEGTAGLTLL